MAVRAIRVDDVPAKPSDVEGLEWHPIRHHLGIGAFGTNGYVGRRAGDLVIEDHSEDEHEELYVVLTGAARFVVDGDTIEAPAGTLVHVTPPSQRVAHAAEDDTTILVVGGAPGKAFEVSPWEIEWGAG